MIRRTAMVFAVTAWLVAGPCVAEQSVQISAIEDRLTTEVEALVDATGAIPGKDREKAADDLRKGVAAHDSGDFDKAVKLFSRAIERWPTFADAYYERANTRATLGEQLESFEDVTRAVLLDPKLEAAHILKASLLDDLGLSDRALAAYEQLLEIKPDSYFGQLNYAITLMRMSRLDEAEKVLETARSLRPEHPSVYLHLAILARERGNNYDEQRHLESFVEFGQGDPRLPAVEERLETLTSHTISLNPGSPTFSVEFVEQSSRALWKSTKHHLVFPDAGGYARSFEEESDVMTSVVKAWREAKAKNPELTHARYQMWTAVVDAGFLDEFIWYVNQNTFGEPAAAWLAEHRDSVAEFLDWAEEAGYYTPDDQEKDTGETAEEEVDLPAVILQLAEASELAYSVLAASPEDCAASLKREARRFRKELELAGDHRLTRKDAIATLEHPDALTGILQVLDTLRVLLPGEPEWTQASNLCGRFGMRAAGELELPRPFPYSVDAGRSEIEVGLCADADPAWIIYAMAKAVFRAEQALRREYGAPPGDAPTVVEELFAWTALLQGYVNGREGDDGEGDAVNPFLERVLAIEDAGELEGFVLFEVIHKVYDVPLERLDEGQVHELQRYLLKHVFESVTAAGGSPSD